MVTDSLCPARNRCVLCAYAAAHGQDCWPARRRSVENNTDVPSVAKTTGSCQRACEGLLDLETDCQQERARAVVSVGSVVRVVEQRAEKDLGDIVATCRKLIQNFSLRDQPRLFNPVYRPRRKNQPRDVFPVECRVDVVVRLIWLALLNLRTQCSAQQVNSSGLRMIPVGRKDCLVDNDQGPGETCRLRHHQESLCNSMTTRMLRLNKASVIH